MDMIQGIEKAALSVRLLTIDAVEKAASGHPGLPLGLAEFGALLYGELLKHHPAAPDWIDRDRFVLSAGHGSMWLYSLLFLSGYKLELEELKNFRQIHSRTAGHPELHAIPGIETTTGPLGQGIANAVGLALAERFLAKKFNTAEHQVIDHFTYALAGDGCMMEGVASEACSFAGHQKLGKLIVFYDSNKITIDGSTDLAFIENTRARFEAYGFKTFKASAYDLKEIMSLTAKAKADTDRPTLIVLESLIGKGSPNKQGTAHCHGAPLGPEEVKATKRALGVPEDEMFRVEPDALAYFAEKKTAWRKSYEEWQARVTAWRRANPALAALWDGHFSPDANAVDQAAMPEYKAGDKPATRDSNGVILNAAAKVMPWLVGGSADLAASNKTRLKDEKDLQAGTPDGRNINFGVREHGMGSICNGLALHGGLRPFCATFFVFADYMRPPIRLAAIMKLPVLYIFTHDSIYVGEDGPTHEPVEQFASLRAIPGLDVWRPGDAEENVEIFKAMCRRTDGPSMIGLTRQGLPVYAKADKDWRKNIARGAYVVKEAAGRPGLVVIATGSEVGTALDAVAESGRTDVRVVSMPCRERFLKLPRPEREKVVPAGVKRVVVEAGVSLGWEGLAGEDGLLICLDEFGISGSYKAVSEHFGFHPKKIAEKIKKL